MQAYTWGLLVRSRRVPNTQGRSQGRVWIPHWKKDNWAKTGCVSWFLNTWRQENKQQVCHHLLLVCRRWWQLHPKVELHLPNPAKAWERKQERDRNTSKPVPTMTPAQSSSSVHHLSELRLNYLGCSADYYILKYVTIRCYPASLLITCSGVKFLFYSWWSKSAIFDV